MPIVPHRLNSFFDFSFALSHVAECKAFSTKIDVVVGLVLFPARVELVVDPQGIPTIGARSFLLAMTPRRCCGARESRPTF